MLAVNLNILAAFCDSQIAVLDFEAESSIREEAAGGEARSAEARSAEARSAEARSAEARS